MTAAPRRWGERRLPALQPGERLLWRGAPAWRGVARRVFHVPVVLAYFVLLTLADMAIVRAHEGAGMPVVNAALPTLLSGGAAVSILLALSWAVGRTTSYVLTTRRLVLQFGVALPATLSIPLGEIAAVSARVRADDDGDVTLRIKGGAAPSFAKLWPHVRPWHFGTPQPMLRDVPALGAALPLLCRTLSANQMVQRDAAA